MKDTKILLLLAITFQVTGCMNFSLEPDPVLVQLQAPQAVIFDTDMAHEDMIAAIFTDDSLASFTTIPLVVVETEGTESGRTSRAANGPAIRVATSAKRDSFEQLLLTILNWQE